MTSSKVVRVFTFGWSPEFVVRFLVKDGVAKDDTVVLISAKPEADYAKARVDEAYKQVVDFLKIVGVTNTYHYEVDLNQDFIGICRDVSRIMKLFSGPVKLYLTGGMRVLVLACLVVAKLMIDLGREVEVELSREDRITFFSIPQELLSISLREVTRSHIEILKLLKSFGEATFEDLALGRSEVTVRKHLYKLEEKGLVTHTAKGRRHVYRLTPVGELILDVVG